jgi:hypothetical protein
MIKALRVECRRTALDAWHLVAFSEQQLGQIRPVLARDASD